MYFIAGSLHQHKNTRKWKFCALLRICASMLQVKIKCKSSENALTVPLAQYCVFQLLGDVLSHSLVLKESLQ